MTSLAPSDGTSSASSSTYGWPPDDGVAAASDEELLGLPQMASLADMLNLEAFDLHLLPFSIRGEGGNAHLQGKRQT